MIDPAVRADAICIWKHCNHIVADPPLLRVGENNVRVVGDRTSLNRRKRLSLVVGPAA
jgi:hypothetical protein